MRQPRTRPNSYWLTFGGERVTHLYPNDCYFAHLSIYYFALPFARDKVVLDAGSGSGYGANFLANHGASFVYGVDASALAVQFSDATFKRPNLAFRQMDLEQITIFPEHSFDLILTSNALEHVANVQDFLFAAHSVLKPDGVLIVAVPPLTNAASKAADSGNPYHLNIWSPRQWHYVFGLYFDQVQPFRHYFKRSDIRLDFVNSPRRTRITEQDFGFDVVSLAEMHEMPTLSALFVIRGPKPAHQLPAPGAAMRYVDDSYTRLPRTQTVAITGLRPLLWQKSLEVLRRRGPRELLLAASRYLVWQVRQRWL